MAAAALIFSYLEALLPPLVAGLPGIKMGLPNIVIIVTLYMFGVKEAAAVSLVRLLLSSFMFGNLVTLTYSLAGAVLSLTVMAFLKKLDAFSQVGVSVAGGVTHNIGQILVAVLILQTPQIAYYLLVLTVSGTVAGLLIGLAGSYVLKYLSRVLP
ncbi:MAG: Gx transporter family protein [Lachnospiraceae bacterium]|nr:Gx transporter family protein [Lachnospiraceae bacterium]